MNMRACGVFLFLFVCGLHSAADKWKKFLFRNVEQLTYAKLSVLINNNKTQAFFFFYTQSFNVTCIW